MLKKYARPAAMAGTIILALGVAGCGGGSREESTIRKACLANGAVSKDYCSCFSDSLAKNMEKDDLKAYAGLMDKVLKAQSGDEDDFQLLLGEAMASGFDDPEMAMRIGQASQKATQACYSKR